MLPRIILFVATLLFTLTLDMIWLGGIAKTLYAKQIGHFFKPASQGNVITMWSAGIVYSALIIGILCFVLPKANGNPWLGVAWGALFGAITYSIYDFTNYAILADWPLAISLIDCAWGTILCGLTSGFAVFLQRGLGHML